MFDVEYVIKIHWFEYLHINKVTKLSLISLEVNASPYAQGFKNISNYTKLPTNPLPTLMFNLNILSTHLKSFPVTPSSSLLIRQYSGTWAPSAAPFISRYSNGANDQRIKVVFLNGISLYRSVFTTPGRTPLQLIFEPVNQSENQSVNQSMCSLFSS